MIQFACWKCSKSLRAAPKNAGRKCKCHGCGEINTIPGTFDEVHRVVDVQEPSDELLAATATEPSVELAEPEPFALRKPQQADRHFVEYKAKEPWYFKAIEYWCYLNIVLGFLGLLIVLFLFAKQSADMYSVTKDFGQSLRIAFAGTVYIAIVALGYVAGWAVILVFLDVARNIRGIRHAAFKIANNSDA